MGLCCSLVAAVGGAVWAGSTSKPALTTSFDVVAGTVLPAKGRPMPAGGSHVGMFWNRSTVSKTVEGPGRVVMTGVGSWCDGWPLIQLRVDGKIWWRSYINSADRYGRYPMGRALPEGTHRISFQMVNDKWSKGGCDRNAYLADAWVAPPPAEPSPTEPSPTEPDPTTPSPTEPSPTEPDPTTPSPTEPSPTEPDPTTPSPTEPAPTQPSPPEGGVPGPSNTGVPDGTKLRVHDGDLVITKPGTVIDGLDIHGFVEVRADDVTIKNSLVRGGDTKQVNRSLVAAHGGQTGLRIVDSTLKGDRPTPYLDGLKGKSFVAERVDISNVVDTAVVLGDDVVIKNSWLHGNRHFVPDPRTPDGKSHDDNIQVEGGSNILIQGNRLEGADNAAIMMTQNAARSSNVRVLDNQLSDGSCTINLADNKGRGPFLGVVIEGNEFGESRHHADRCPMRVPASSDVRTSDNTWMGGDEAAVANDY